MNRRTLGPAIVSYCVFTRYPGDVETLKKHGLKVTVNTGEDLISWTIDAAELGYACSLENVAELRAYEPRYLRLNTSVPQIWSGRSANRYTLIHRVVTETYAASPLSTKLGESVNTLYRP